MSALTSLVVLDLKRRGLESLRMLIMVARSSRRKTCPGCSGHWLLCPGFTAAETAAPQLDATTQFQTYVC